MHHAGRIARGARRAFTLVELLVVITIIAVLAGILFPVIFKGQGQADKAVCASLIQQLEVAINAFEGHFGDFPPSSFEAYRRLRDDRGNLPFKGIKTPSNTTNIPSESLVIALSAAVAGLEPFEWGEDQIGNTDGDKLDGVPGWDLGTNEAFEAMDPWGFPLVYIHHRDYGKKFKIRSDDGETVNVKAQKSKKLKNFHKRRSYQLFSLGPDGQPGTDDDIRNW